MKNAYKAAPLFILGLLSAVNPAKCQTAAIVYRSVISAYPADSTHYEKTIGQFTTTPAVSYFLGTDSNGYIEDSALGQVCSIGIPGSYVGGSTLFTYPGDSYSGIIASFNNSIVWLENPLNWGANVCQSWQVQTINPNQAAHALRLADLDGDGQLDVVGSGTQYPATVTTGTLSFQDNFDSWAPGAFLPPAGDAIDVVAINGVNAGARTNIVACNPNDNSLYWYQNPGGSAARGPGWIAHLIANTSVGGAPACTQGVTLSSLNVGSRDIVIVASGDSQPWAPGLGYYDPGADPTSPWTFYQIDSTYLDVHNIATDTLNGVPFFVAGEQEQASQACNGSGYNDHGSSYSGCRVTVFAWNGTGFTPTLVSNLGSQNQVLYQTNGVEYLAGANHNSYDATDPNYNLWQFTFGGSSLAAPTPQRFIPVSPCRIIDTRNTGPLISGGSTRDITVAGVCGIPSSATAYSLNVTVVPSGSLGFLTAWAGGQARPVSSLLNSDGRTKANAAIVPAGDGGTISIFATDDTQLVLDVNGYFITAGSDPGNELSFYPIAPCRVLDTRTAIGPDGGPVLGAMSTRSLDVLSGPCNIPATAAAYSMNYTAVPRTGLSYLTTWPTGQPLPVASTLNAFTGEVTANAAIVPAGQGGAVSIFVTEASDLVIDVNGYFAPPGTGGLSLYNVLTCRAFDSRLSGYGNPIDGTVTVDVQSSLCSGGASSVPTVVLNATTVPIDSLGFLSILPSGAPTTTSTLNADDSVIASNMAIVPTNSGKIDIFTPSERAHVILDIWGYFAP